MLFRFRFPVAHRIQPELLKPQRPGEFTAGELDHIRLIRKVGQILPDETPMQFTPHRIGHVIKLFRHEDALVARKRWRLGKTRAVDVVCRPPRTIHPMRPGFDNVVLEITFVEQHQPARIANSRERFQPRPIPRIKLRKIIFAQAIPCRALAATRERLLIKRCPHITVHTTHALMIFATTVVPQPVMMIERRIMPRLQPIRHRSQTIRQPRPLTPRRKPGQIDAVVSRFARMHITAPPVDAR